MRLKILLPDQVLLDEAVEKIVAEGQDGSFCLLPRHVDWAEALVPGILCLQTAADVEEFVAVDEGILIKQGPEVLVSTRNAVRSRDLAELQRVLRERIRNLDERERMARAALARLEALAVRRLAGATRRDDEESPI
jgi:F-type H+-transporting ATPase subunit epsilon